MNLRKTSELALDSLAPEDSEVVRERLGVLVRLIDDAPKSLKWRARARIGDRVKWYREVEEVERD
jgi:hypothetical protein